MHVKPKSILKSAYSKQTNSQYQNQILQSKNGSPALNPQLGAHNDNVDQEHDHQDELASNSAND